MAHTGAAGRLGQPAAIQEPDQLGVAIKSAGINLTRSTNLEDRQVQIQGRFKHQTPTGLLRELLHRIELEKTQLKIAAAVHESRCEFCEVPLSTTDCSTRRTQPGRGPYSGAAKAIEQLRTAARSHVPCECTDRDHPDAHIHQSFKRMLLGCPILMPP